MADSHADPIALGPQDVGDIVALERASFVAPLQAGAELVLRRFELGHVMLGIRERGRLAGMIAFSRASFDPGDFPSFPKTFREFSTQPPAASPNAIFIYNLEVDRTLRGGRIARVLVQEALDRALAEGLDYAVADGRVSSYSGSEDCPQEKVRPSHRLRRSIDRHLAGGPYPSREELLADPTLALYHRLTGCDFHWIIPDFLPEDRASGGIRVILYGALSRWRAPGCAGALSNRAAAFPL